MFRLYTENCGFCGFLRIFWTPGMNSATQNLVKNTSYTHGLSRPKKLHHFLLNFRSENSQNFQKYWNFRRSTSHFQPTVDRSVSVTNQSAQWDMPCILVSCIFNIKLKNFTDFISQNKSKISFKKKKQKNVLKKYLKCFTYSMIFFHLQPRILN